MERMESSQMSLKRRRGLRGGRKKRETRKRRKVKERKRKEAAALRTGNLVLINKHAYCNISADILL